MIGKIKILGGRNNALGEEDLSSRIETGAIEGNRNLMSCEISMRLQIHGAY